MPKVDHKPFIESVPVRFEVADGVKPTKDSAGTLSLRLPYPVVLKPGEEFEVNLGLKCSYPVHIFAAWEKKSQGLDLVDGVWACQDANQPLMIKIKNTNQSGTLVMEYGELVAKAAVLYNPLLQIE